MASAGDINRQSIIFYEHTPEVFYCPLEKPISLEGMIVKARPIEKLCEHDGKRLPDDYVSDCWNDVDETHFACSEKKRILLKLKPPGWENAIVDNFVPILRKGEYKIAGKEQEEKRMKLAIQEDKILEERLRLEEEAKLEESKRKPKSEQDF